MRRKELLNRLEEDKEFKKTWEWVCEQNNDVVADKILKLQSQITDLKKQNKAKTQKENIDTKNNKTKEEIKVVDVKGKEKSTSSNKKKKTTKTNTTTKINKGKKVNKDEIL